MIKKVCVVGSGVLGCYMTKKLLDEGFEVHLFDVGNKKVLNEEEIGFKSSSNFEYKGAREGRYFGLGGTSEKWGGQILLFDKKDFKNPNKFLSEIISLNELYSDRVYEKLIKRLVLLICPWFRLVSKSSRFTRLIPSCH
jgi:hypothetical protein